MTRLDLLGGIFFTILGLLMIFVAIPLGTEQGVYFGLTPTFFPTLLASGLTFCALGLTLQSVGRLLAGKKGGPVPISRWNLMMFVLLVTVILSGIILIDRFGLVIGAPVLIAVLMIVMGDRNPLRIVASAVLPVAGFYGLALYILHTPVP